MKHKKFKKILEQAEGTVHLIKTLMKDGEVYFLNDLENDHTQGGNTGEDCPKLDKKSCGPYGSGLCSINLELKRRKKKDRKG